jgi:hypothetical protein
MKRGEEKTEKRGKPAKRGLIDVFKRLKLSGFGGGGGLRSKEKGYEKIKRVQNSFLHKRLYFITIPSHLSGQHILLYHTYKNLSSGTPKKNVKKVGKNEKVEKITVNRRLRR